MLQNLLLEGKIKKYLLDHVPDYESKDFEQKKMMFKKIIMGCKSCSLCSETEWTPIAPILNKKSEAIFIGRNPSKTEGLRNEVFPTESNVGRMFDQYLSVMGFGRGNVSVMNLVNCVTKQNRPPEQEKINICVSFVTLCLELIDPDYKVIFLMGNDAVRWYYGPNSPGVLKIHGNIREIDNKIIVPILHPSHILIEPDYKKDVATVLKLAREVYERKVKNA